MNREEFISLFPLKAEITKNIIDEADIDNVKNCIGALTLKSMIPNIEEITKYWGWGTTQGTQKLLDGSYITLTTTKNIDMMGVKRPRKAVFIIKN